MCDCVVCAYVGVGVYIHHDSIPKLKYVLPNYLINGGV